MSITEIIKPIELLSGSHADTAITGQGCFMNVIAYLNGEAQITDKSECVCFVVRPIVIWLNDYMFNSERAQLIPFIERAMGSRTDDRDVISTRAWLAVEFAKEMSSIAAAYAAAAAHAAAAHAAHADAAAAHAARAAAAAAAAAHAARAAAAAAHAAHADAADADAAHKKIIDAGMRFLDAALPKPIEHSPDVINRARELISIPA